MTKHLGPYGITRSCTTTPDRRSSLPMGITGRRPPRAQTKSASLSCPGASPNDTNNNYHSSSARTQGKRRTRATTVRLILIKPIHSCERRNAPGRSQNATTSSRRSRHSFGAAKNDRKKHGVPSFSRQTGSQVQAGRRALERGQVST